jgi:hypothetical protein
MHSMFRTSLLTFSTVALAVAPLHAQERYTLSGSEVTIHNLAGTMQVVAGSGSATEVVITRMGRDAQELRVVPATSGNASSLRVLYPRDDILYPRMSRSSQTTLEVRGDGTFGGGVRGSGRRVTIASPDRAVSGAMEAAADIIVRVPTGVRLTTHLAVGDVEVSGVSGTFSVNTVSGTVNASNVRGNVSLRATSGRVHASAVEGDVTVRTASGNVRLDNISGRGVSVNVSSGSIEANALRAPTVELKTSSGRVRGGDIHAERLTIASSSGSVAARSVAADEAKLTTASGSVELELIGPARVTELRAVSGSVTLRVPQNMGATVDLRTTSGGIAVSAPMIVSSSRRGHTSGTIGDGSGQISARTTSGSITVSTR